MEKEKKKKYDEFKSFVTYEDILTFALALADEEHFDAHPDKWHDAIYDICQKYREQIPELKRIYFTYRKPLPPQSEQVDRLIKTLNMSREITLPNPRYPTIDMSQDKKEKIKKREQERLGHYTQQITEIGQLLQAKLGVV